MQFSCLTLPMAKTVPRAGNKKNQSALCFYRAAAPGAFLSGAWEIEKRNSPKFRAAMVYLFGKFIKEVWPE